jgi:hypothetical protein
MKITRTSAVSGITRTLDLDITPEQVAAFNGGALVQNAFPNLSNAEREFILTGVTQEEWDATFADPEQRSDRS